MAAVSGGNDREGMRKGLTFIFLLTYWKGEAVGEAFDRWKGAGGRKEN